MRLFHVSQIHSIECISAADDEGSKCGAAPRVASLGTDGQPRGAAETSDPGTRSGAETGKIPGRIPGGGDLETI